MATPSFTTEMSFVTCPTNDMLRRFLTGRLDEADVAAVSQHLDGCELCRTLVESFPADKLLAALRQPDPCQFDATPWRAIVQRLTDLPRTLARVSAVQALEETLPMGIEPPRTKDELGRLGRYRLREQIGRGGMGIVYLAEDERLQRTVALKMLRPELLDVPEARQRFEREARALARLDHPRVVRVLEVSEIEGSSSDLSARSIPYLTMPILVGESLGDRLRRLRKATPRDQPARLDPREVRRIGRQLAEALAAVHGVGLVHRDIKPDNIWLVAPSNDVVLLDFSVAHAADEPSLTEHGTVIGTPGYMSPQQLNGQVDAHDDLFALGLVLHQLATGALPSAHESLTDDLLSVELAGVIRRLLSARPSDQFADANAVVEALRSKVGSNKSSRAAKFVAATVLASTLALLGWMLWKSSKQSNEIAFDSARKQSSPVDLNSPLNFNAWAMELTSDDAATSCQSMSLAIDAHGRLLVAGVVTYEADLAATSPSSRADAVIACFGSDQQPQWRHTLGGPGDDRAVGVAVDSHGAVLVVGWFSQTVDFDPGPGRAELTAAGITDAFVLKLTSRGEFVWVRQFGGDTERFDVAHGVGVDPEGRITIVGEFAGRTDFDPGTKESFATAAGSHDAFVVQLDANGQLRWLRTFGSDSNDVESANAVAVDQAGDLIVSGRFCGNVSLANRVPLSSPVNVATPDELLVLTARGRGDAFAMRLDHDGIIRWVRTFGSAGESFELVNAVSISHDGKYAAIAGSFQGTDFESGDGLQRESVGDFDAFVTLLDSNGQTLWTKTMGGIADDRALGVILESSGQVHVAGFFNETVNFAGDREPKQVAVCRNPAVNLCGDAFVWSLSREGVFTNLALLQGPSSDSATALATHPSSGLFATGWFTGQAEARLVNKSFSVTSRRLRSIFALRVPPHN